MSFVLSTQKSAKKAGIKKSAKKLAKKTTKKAEKSLFLNLFCCCLETGLKPVLFKFADYSCKEMVFFFFQRCNFNCTLEKTFNKFDFFSSFLFFFPSKGRFRQSSMKRFYVSRCTLIFLTYSIC